MATNKSAFPRIPYSDPEDCAPRLLTFDLLSEGSDYRGGKLPADRTAAGASWCAAIAVPRSETLYLQVYRGTPAVIHLRVYGLHDSGKVYSLTECLEVRQIARRVEVGVGAGKFTSLVVRFSVEKQEVVKGNFVKFAAYDGQEPRSPGGLVVTQRPECRDAYGTNDREARKVTLPFSPDGKAVQRLILASCSPEDDLVAWGKATGLEFSESYRGEAGSVVALGVPPGLDLHTTGGSAKEVRAKVNSGNGTVSPDYLVNLFSPGQPADGGGKMRKVEDDDELREAYNSPRDYLAEMLPSGEPGQDFDHNADPVTVTIIDSGVDYSKANAALWEAARYRQRKETEFVRPWHLGYDFINHDFEPNDETPHGTYVAAALLAQYRAARPLQLVHMKTFGAGGISTYFGSLVSLYEAVTIGSRVINMSWGFHQEEEPEALRCALRTAADRGVYLVTSSGNEGQDLEKIPQWPANFASHFPDHLLTVASYWTPKSGKYGRNAFPDLNDFSNYGDKEVPLAAFMTTGVPEYQTGSPIYPLGTSISTPIVSGLLAHWLADHPEGTLAEFRKTFFRRADSLSDRITDGQYLPLEATRVLA